MLARSADRISLIRSFNDSTFETTATEPGVTPCSLRFVISRQSIVQTGEDMFWPHCLCDAMAIKILLKSRMHARESQNGSACSEFAMQFTNNPRRGVIDVGYCFRIDDQPTQFRGSLTSKAKELLGKPADIRIKERRPETIYCHSRLRSDAGRRRQRLPLPLFIPHQHSGVRTVAMAHHTQQRDDHRQDYALFHTL